MGGFPLSVLQTQWLSNTILQLPEFSILIQLEAIQAIPKQ